MALKCPHCNEAVYPTDSVCMACGKSLTEARQATPEHREQSRTSKTWLWVTIGVVGFVTFVALIAIWSGPAPESNVDQDVTYQLHPITPPPSYESYEQWVARTKAEWQAKWDAKEAQKTARFQELSRAEESLNARMNEWGKLRISSEFRGRGLQYESASKRKGRWDAIRTKYGLTEAEMEILVGPRERLIELVP